jgi:uncharacterized repeat protein (TIGR03803 family)
MLNTVPKLLAPPALVAGGGDLEDRFRSHPVKSAIGSHRESHAADALGSLLLAADGNIYGATNASGTVNQGVVFKLTPTGVLTVLHSFDGIDGASPEAGLVQGSDGNLYGTTLFGGGFGNGAIFSITPDGTLTNLYSFPTYVGVDGVHPYGLMQHTNGSSMALRTRAELPSIAALWMPSVAARCSA